MRCGKKTCAALAAFLILALPTVACSQKNSAGDRQPGAVSGAQASGSGSSGRTMLVGKVTAVVGNQVTLAVGKLNGMGGGGFRRENGGASGTSSQAASSAAGDSASSASSSLITLTGETQTVLIPVGLKLSSGFSGGAGAAFGQRRTSSDSASGMPEGGFGSTPPQGGSGQAGGSASRSGVTGRSFGSGSASGRSFGGTANGTASGSAGAGAAEQQRSSDFSSITTGMILQITEETQSDGTQGIVSVSVLSK